MVKVHVKDGRTLNFDLSCTDDERRWKAAQSVPDFQRTITGMALNYLGEMYTLPIPKLFKYIEWSASVLRDGKGDAIGECISVHADECLATITLYFRQTPRVSRFDVRRIGRPRFVRR